MGATKLILEIAGGTAEDVVQVAGAAPALVGEVTLDENRARRLLGTPAVLVCTSGTVDPPGSNNTGSDTASEGGGPAVFTITGFNAGATCTRHDTRVFGRLRGFLP